MSARGTSRQRRLALAKGVRFECKQCGDCCREFPVSLSPTEAERYTERDWTPVFGAPREVLHTVRRGARVTHYLRRQASGACLFLGDDHLCRVHSVFGEADKPLVCRTFPFVFVPEEGERRVAGAWFSCSSVAHGDGRPLQDRRKELEALEREVEQVQPPPALPAELPFTRERSYAREDIDHLLRLVLSELEDAGRPFPARILAVAKFVSLVASSRFPSLGGNTRRLVDSFADGIRDQVKRDLLRPPRGPASFPERILFRMLLAFAARRDPAKLIEAGSIRLAVRRVGNLVAGLGYLAGSGALVLPGRGERVVVGDVRRRAPAADPASPEADGALTRYFVAQISGRFLHTPSFSVPEVLPALGVLLRQYPLILLFARAACLSRGGSVLDRDDYAVALRMADWSLGRVPWTRGPLGRVRHRLLVDVEATFAHVAWCATPPGRALPAPPEPA